MTTHRNDFHGQTLNTAVTAANLANSGSALDVSPGSGTIEYVADPAGGSRIAVAITPSSNIACYLRDDAFNSAQISVSDCFYYAGLPANGDPLVHQVATSAGWAASITINGSGLVKLSPHSGSSVYASNALTAGHWYRFETQVVSDAGTNGSVKCQWYIDDGDTQTESASATGVETRGGAITRVDRGLNANAASPISVYYYSNLQVQDGTTTPLGAFPTATTTYGLHLWTSGAWLPVTTATA